MSFEFVAVAKAEMFEAIDYYDGKRDGWGKEFLKETNRTLRRISAFPQAWPAITRRSRRCKLNRFPYGVVYQIRDNAIRVIAVQNLEQCPESWELRFRAREI